MVAQIIYGLTHLEAVLLPLFEYFGTSSYAILFAIIFMETGLVIFPFLPGESIIFISSTLATRPHFFLDIKWLVLTFFLAALIGDTVNFEIGRNLRRLPFINRHLEADKLKRATDFFVKHGGKTVIFGRFVPMIRTFIPLIAGMFQMHYLRFAWYNLLGVVIWVGAGSLTGYYLGQLPFVQQHFSILLLGLVVVLMLPSVTVGLSKLIQNRRQKGN